MTSIGGKVTRLVGHPPPPFPNLTTLRFVVAALTAISDDTSPSKMPTEYAKPNQELGPLPQDLQPKRKLRPARKQVKPGEIDKSEGPQPGKEYSELPL